MKTIYFRAFGILMALFCLAGIIGCTTTGDNPDCYWHSDYTDTHGDNRPMLHTPAGEYKTSR
jgi:hypothetical protein